LPGVVEVAKREFKLPASLGYPVDVASPLEKVNDLSFTTAIGLARWGEEATRGKSARGGFGRWSSINHVAGRMKDWFKSLMP